MAAAVDPDSFKYLRSEHNEEMEVLLSIYDGDTNFKPIDGSTIQYKIGEHEEPLSVLVEIKWTQEYPESVPTISLDSFYNQHLSQAAKKETISAILEEAEKNIGDPQSYTLIEWMKDNILTLIGPHVFDEVCRIENRENRVPDQQETEETTKKDTGRKEQLTKSQKRRVWDRVDNEGNRPRGHDWVDVIRHLSQTGGSQQSAPTVSASVDLLNPPT